MAAAALLRHARWLLVDRPAVASFHWRPGTTLAASPSFAAAAVCAYLAAVLLLHRRVLPLPYLPPRVLRALSAVHNVVLLSISATMAAGCVLAAAATAPPPRPRRRRRGGSSASRRAPPLPRARSSTGRTSSTSKIYELGDTLLILLARRPLTFLHVYHHALVIAMCYLWLATAQSLLPVALVTNAAVHVVMYAYYLCCVLGLRWPPRWKRAVTELQIAQFVFSFAASVVMLWFHFARGGCEGMAGWAFNAVFNASLLALFLDFHGAAYAAAAKGKKRSSNSGKKSD